MSLHKGISYMELLCVLIFTIQFTTGQDTTYIDINSDIPNNVSWVLDCPAGYSELVTDFNCRESGGVDLPETDLSGQVGFWTTCVDRCDVKYVVDPADVSYKARIYQRNMLTEVFDGRRTEFIEGEGWTDFEVALGSGQTEIKLSFYHLSPEYYTVLDKIAVNGNLPPIGTGPTLPPETTTERLATESTTRVDEPSTTTEEPTTTEEVLSPGTEGPTTTEEPLTTVTDGPTTTEESLTTATDGPTEEPLTTVEESTTTEGFTSTTDILRG